MSGISADWAWMTAWPSERSPSARPEDGTDGADGADGADDVDGATAGAPATGVLGSEPMSVTARARPQRTGSGTSDELETRLIATVPQVMRHLVAHARRRRAWKQLTYQQYNVLRIIHGEGALPPGEIARRLLVTAPVVTRLASGLVGPAWWSASVTRRTSAPCCSASRRPVAARRRPCGATSWPRPGS